MSDSNNRKGTLLRTLATIFVVTILFSYPWELAQAYLYRGGEDFSKMLWHCLPASLGDGLLLLFIFFMGWFFFRRRDWFEKPGLYEYAFMLILGLAVGVGIEWLSLHSGLWTYTSRMPLIPGLNIGVVPVALMLVLPPLIFRLAAIWLR